ncbi:MAG TPA: tRNA (adenosine(37)-N6)-threonylcarbamoyltransferase complex ATPase subunit type 1 TsaE [Anaerolineaceae bacterium]|nr:tRNA (adenosine(37)-N6)-threonylcarbamoyltransferase complex ATPase subunit type 1 TsaE [Anaerolineaceae bacterium]
MPILSSHDVDFLSRSPEQTRRLGIRLGALLKPGDVVCLSGDLGAGKTTFVQGVAKGWGSLDPVSSPTFVLVNQYRQPDGKQMHHLDAYRIESVPEAEDLDIDALFMNGPLVVEWSERIAAALPPEYLQIDFSWVADEQRRILFSPHGERYVKLLEDFRRLAFGG